VANNNIVLTGIPRSGTTLTCYLLNQVPDTVALHEPYNPFYTARPGTTHSDLVAMIDAFFETTRVQLLRDGTARSKQLDGRIPDNPKGDYGSLVRLVPNRLLGRPLFGRALLRKRRVEHGLVRFDKPLTDDFTLCVKHNAAYTVLLDTLIKRYRCFVIVRNPVAVIGSWNSIDFDLRRGDMTITDRLDPQLAAALDDEPDRLDRQCLIVEWYFRRYRALVSRDQLIRYEDLVADPTATIRRVCPDAPVVNLQLASKNTNRAYNRSLMRSVAERLADRPSAVWDFYPPHLLIEPLRP
jgi:hypothetical protein